MACLPFESPKLLATAIIDERDFATLLDQRLKRIAQAKLIEAKPTNNDKIVEGNPVDARLPGAAVKNLSHRASRNVASAWLIPRHSGTAQLGLVVRLSLNYWWIVR